MATSPGRSAIQATPAAMTAIETRKRTIRIILSSPLAKCVRGLARKLTRGDDRSLPRLRLRDPALCRRPRRYIELAEIGECVINGRARCFFLDASQHGRRVVTRGHADRTDTHEPGGTRLQPLQIIASRRLSAGRFHDRRNQRTQLLRKRFDGWHATRREGDQRRQRLLTRTEKSYFIEFGDERRTARDGVAQRCRAERKPCRIVRRRNLDRLFKR